MRTVAAFRGDRLLIRAAGKTRRVVDGACDAAPCAVVGAPVAGAEGVFAYAVAFPGIAGFVASVTPTGSSRVVEEDKTDLAAIAVPNLVATTAAAVVWVEEGGIRIAAAVGGTGAVIVTAEQTGGEISSLAAADGMMAWSARTPTGGTIIRVRTLTGQISTRAQEAVSATATLSSVAVAANGTVVAVRRSFPKNRQRISLVAFARGGARSLLLSSDPIGRNEVMEPMRPAASGSLVAARRRVKSGGGRDEIWVINLATGKSVRVATADRSTAQLSDPSLGGGRIGWARTELQRGSLKRARILTAAVRQ